MKPIEKNYERTLHNIQKRDGVFIQINGKQYLDFSSNDYLGLANHPKLKAASIQAIEEFGTGATASRLLSGSYDLHANLEDKIAKFKHKEAALVFNSGYQANIGLIQTLFEKGDVIFSDKLNHASIVDGLRLSGIRFFRFKHNDMNDLERLLKKEHKNFKRALVITETVFSMDGDIAPLDEIVKLKNIYNFEIMIDEAHSLGVSVPKEIEYLMGTFSKGFGSFGAYFACSENVKKYLINKCRSFIFSTALPPAVIAANIAAIEVVENEPERATQVLANAKYLREKLGNALGDSQIVPLVIGDTEKTVQLADKLKNSGFWVLPIRYPTVPKNEARLRFSLSFNHTTEMLDGLVVKILDC